MDRLLLNTFLCQVIPFFACLVLFLFFPVSVHAFTFTPTDDPQYVVMNFSTINELNWAAPEDEWRQKIKPQVVEQINELRKALPPGNTQHKLAWSTLMEYMNFPFDQPSLTSPYAVKMRRILEITDEENIPVFVPLNGFQWWDHLPELYNWWDPDGTHTDPKFFARQKNPSEFKQRFIKGYNPENKWNVEWQDWQTPMKLNYRNWGGGGFRLAPPPNLFNQKRTQLTYRQLQRQRLRVIVQQMIPFLSKWQKEGRSDLFAGLTIGTEVSLNASVKPSDEFLPYGYRDIQDQLCDVRHPTCGVSSAFTSAQIELARQQSVNQYLLDLTQFVANFGIPKQRVYTHVWGEATQGEPRHVNYAAVAPTLYARPGMSFYGYAQDPLSLADWSSALKENGEQSWGATEYSAGTSPLAWRTGLNNVFNNSITPAHVLVIYNWGEHKGTGAIPALATFLNENSPAPNQCVLPEIFTRDGDGVQNPARLTWRFISQLPENVAAIILHIKHGGKLSISDPDVFVQKVSRSDNFASLPTLQPGVYSWYIEVVGCEGHVQLSEPRRFVINPPENFSRTQSWWEQLINWRM